MNEPNVCPKCGAKAISCDRFCNTYECGRFYRHEDGYLGDSQSCQIACLTRELDRAIEAVEKARNEREEERERAEAAEAKLGEIELEIHSGEIAENIRLNVHRILHPQKASVSE